MCKRVVKAMDFVSHWKVYKSVRHPLWNTIFHLDFLDDGFFSWKDVR